MGQNRKGAVVNAKPKKKKRSKCCSCLIAFAITLLVLFAGLFAAGWVIGDKLTQEHLGMGIGDVLGAYFDVRTVSEKKMELTTYSDADVAGFEKSLRSGLFLNDNATIPYDELAEAVFGSFLPSGGSGAASPAAASAKDKPAIRDTLLMEAIRDNGIVTNEGEEAVEDDFMTNMLAALLKRENIDTQRLEEYEGGEVKLEFKDQEIAAFVNKLLRTQLNKMQETDGPFDIAAIAKELEISQVKIYGTADVPVLRVTARANTSAIAKPVLRDLVPGGLGWLTDFGAWLLLPKHTYVSIDLSFGETPTLTWQLNNLDAEKSARIERLISAIAKATGNEIDVQGELDKVNDEYIKPVIGEFREYMIFPATADGKSNGKVSADLFGTALAVSKINEGKSPEDTVTSSEIIYAMKGFLVSEAVENPDADYNGQYRKILDGSVIYKPADFSDTTKYELVDYKEEFMKELRDKYLLSPTAEFDDVMGLFGIGGKDTENFIDKINLSDIGALAKSESPQKLVLSDRMLGVLFNEFISTILGEDGTLGSLDPQISYVILKKTGAAGAEHNVIEVAFTVDVVSALGEAGQFIAALLPGERVMLTVEIDITPSDRIDPETNPYAAGKLRYNDLSDAETTRLLNTLRKFGLDLGDLLDGQIAPQFRSVIDTMFGVMPGIELGESYRVPDGYVGEALKAGSLFDLVAQQLNNMAKGESPETTAADELKDIVAALWIAEEEAQERLNPRPAHLSYNRFMQEVRDKFYLASEPEDFDGIKAVIDAEGFNYEALNVSGEYKGEDGSDGRSTDEKAQAKRASLAYDPRGIGELKPFLHDRDFGAVMREELNKQTDPESLKGFKALEGVRAEPVFTRGGTAVAGAAVDNADKGTGTSPDGTLSLVISVDKTAFADGDNLTYLEILPATVYFTLVFDISEQAVLSDGGKDYYGYRIKINDMNETEYQNLLKIMRLAIGEEPGIDRLAVEIGKTLYEQLSDLRERLGEENFVFVAREAGADNADGEEIEYGFEIGSVYDFLASTVKDGGGEKVLDAQTLKEAVQGMYPYDGEIDNRANYTITKRPGTVPTDYQAILLGPDPYLIDDNDFGAVLSQGLLLAPGGNNPFAGGGKYELAQFASASETAGRAKLTIVFEVKVGVVSGADFAEGKAGFRGLMPEEMYFTFEINWAANAVAPAQKYNVVPITEAGGTQRIFKINGLTAAQQTQIFALTGYDPADLTNQTGECESALSNLPPSLEYRQAKVAIPKAELLGALQPGP